MEDKEAFLSRWSRRKLEAKEDAPAGDPKMTGLPAVAPAAPLPPATEPTAPGIAEGVTAEYREFFDPRVEEKLRRTALKKLFGDPHFNVMDGLDTYVDDYSKPDPIPAAMLRQLNQAKDLLLFDDDKKPAGSVSDEARIAGEAAAASPAAPTDMSTPATPAAPGVPGADAAPGTTATPPLDGIRNE